jgi:tetratricopeptide (TPR) repeat protein
MREKLIKIANFGKRFSKEIFIALVLAIIAAIFIEIFQEKRGEETLRKNQKAVAMVGVYDANGELYGQGSGIFVARNGICDGTLITNYHVIERAKSITAKLSSGAYYKAKGFLAADKKFDIAIIQFEAKDVPSIKKFGDSDKVKIGEKVFAIGAPMGLENTVSQGNISYPKRNLGGIEFIQFSAPISSGSSGGGLFDSKGKIIGITSGSIKVPHELKESDTAQNLNFAIPINLIRDSFAGKVKKITEDSPDYFYSEGVLAENEKDYDKAIKCFEKSIELNNAYTDAYLELGYVYYDKGLYDEQLGMFKKAVELDPNNSDAHYYLALAYEDKSQYDLAIAEYKKVIELKPEYKDAIHGLGILYIMQGEKEKALELVPKLMELNIGLGNELKILIDRTK